MHGKKNYTMASVVFLFLFTFCQFRICSLLMKICDMPSAFFEFEAFYLRAYWLESSGFIKPCSKVVDDNSQSFSF